MAKIEANQAGADEGLMLNDQGYIAECTADNIFVIKRGEIFTPPITAGALRGITRSVVFEIAAELGIKISEAEISRHDIFMADECFFTGTAAEVIPVIRADGRVIGTGKPGPITPPDDCPFPRDHAGRRDADLLLRDSHDHSAREDAKQMTGLNV